MKAEGKRQKAKLQNRIYQRNGLSLTFPFCLFSFALDENA